MATKSRFTFRSLDRDARDLAEQSVWSATPGTDDVAYLQALRDAIASTQPARLVTPALEAEATAFVQVEHPAVRKARFEFDAHTVHVDEDLRVVYVDLSGRLWASNADGKEFTTEEFDYYAAQTAMSLLERHVSRSAGPSEPGEGPSRSSA